MMSSGLVATIALVAVQAADETVQASPDALIAPGVKTYQVTVRQGQDESCVLNPPLVLAAKDVEWVEQGAGYDLRRIAPNGGQVLLIAFGPKGFFDSRGDSEKTVTLSIDVLTVTPTAVTSQTGEAWELFDRKGSGVSTRLIPKSTAYSLCRPRPVPGAAMESRSYGRVISSNPAGIRTKLSTAATAILDIFGLSAESWVRVRLSSEPPGADLYLGRARQPPQTNTVLDVVAAELPQLRLEKRGYEPCAFRRWTAAFEPRSNKRVLNASCKLVPVKRKAR